MSQNMLISYVFGCTSEVRAKYAIFPTNKKQSNVNENKKM